MIPAGYEPPEGWYLVLAERRRMEAEAWRDGLAGLARAARTFYEAWARMALDMERASAALVRAYMELLNGGGKA